MLNSKRLLQMVKKWQKIAALGRRRIMSAGTISGAHSCKLPIACRGHLFVYSTDGKRFMVPLSYLSNSLFRELFGLSEEEFGLPVDGPITMPCDSSCMEYIISLLHLGASKDVQKAVFASIACDRCSVSSVYLQQHNQQQCMALYGF